MRHMLSTLLAALLLVLTHVGCDNSTAATDTAPAPQGQSPTAPAAAEPTSAALTEQLAEPAFIIIHNAGQTDPQLLVRQLQQVLPKTQVVTQAQSPNPREIKLQVTNVNDLRALANLIPFAQVESVDDRTRTIIVDFEL